MQVQAPLICYEEGYSKHARGTPNMAKPPLDRGYEGPKTHQKWPEMKLGSMQVKAPLKGLEQDCSTHA